MPVTIHPKGTPLPDDHPLKGGRIIFGGQRRPSETKQSKEPVSKTTEPDLVWQRASQGMLEQASPPTQQDKSPSPTRDKPNDP